ncbi:MAG TPA: UvrD-helicase domain-containing protein [Polyangia bacterium]|nr:UvrD-helicase domain-containing protein [Polyangia bacterium]
MSAPGFHPFPEQLAHIPRDRAAVVEASAGTGKTFLIEHLVVDRLLRGDARIEEMLVVTFTERAAAELRRRVHALVRQVAAAEPAPAGSPATTGWTIDEEARARLASAARQIDVAPISTIHAFCQRILTEQAFAGGRLLVQENVESRAAFSAAFAEVIRQELSVDPALAPYLETYLTVRRSTGMLESLLYRAHQLRVPFQPPFEPAAVDAAARALAAIEIGELLAAVAGHHSTVKAVRDRLQTLHTAAQVFATRGDLPGFLAAVDPIVASRKEGFDYLTENLAAGARARAPVVALADAAVSLETAVAALFLPRIAERVAARKRAAGLYDFDDMLALVRDALRGPRGGELIATLRARFKLAIVDEFQDTDPIQWEIFRTIFADSSAHPIYLVGDPKQSIYGFRGADVATYATACETIAAPDERHHLTRNFRSTPAIVDAYNAILDADADPPFFSHGPTYRPVVAGRADATAGADMSGPPITLLRVTADQEITKLPMRAVREALARAVADEVAAQLHAGQPAREVFVLTRTWREARTIEQALTSRGVAAAIYNQENLHASAEAGHVRDLLRAVADPRDPGRRLRAWLTPFFGLSLGDLPAAAAAGADHPLHARLYGWHAAAARQPLGRLYPRILDESGVLLRELFLGESARRLVNYRHLFEMLAAQDARVARPLGDVVRRLAALCAGLTAASPEEGDVERIESDRDAVQIMTMHKSKGLEADVVFVYGGFSPVQGRGVRLYTRDGQRAAVVGKGRRQAVAEAIKREAESEDQRLFYVALTRARKRLVLPFDGAVEAELGLEEAREELWKVNGGYAHVHRRLRALTAGGASHHFGVREVPVDPRAPGDSLRPRANLGMFGWQPDRVPAVPAPPATELARLARERLGPTYTSYSRIKQDEGGYRPPTEMRDEAKLAPRGEDDLPGGARAGIFVHDLLERVPLETLRATPELADWIAREDVRALLETTLRRHGRDAAQLKPAARLAHAALTTALPVVGGALPGLASAPQVIREMEFLFPFPEAAGGARRGFVKGYVDVVFEHEGRAYLIDWKTDRLSSWEPAAVEAHVDANYGLQERLYALALVRALRIADAASYERRFGGTLYVFLRGLPGAVRSRRPTFAELEAWQRDLGDELGGQAREGVAAAGASP